MIASKYMIEPRFKESVDAYVATGRPTGGFLMAVLTNNLTEAIGRADESALENIPHIVAYLYNDCPGPCWGSTTRVDEWLHQHEQARAEQRKRGTH